jgi:hypothetical protein
MPLRNCGRPSAVGRRSPLTHFDAVQTGPPPGGPLVAVPITLRRVSRPQPRDCCLTDIVGPRYIGLRFALSEALQSLVALMLVIRGPRAAQTSCHGP